ncbi:interleukin-1 receptor accessory protein-like 1 [Penaeus chinensis]|uniref:interleukin-1 receptor accessory protein-like 1 n=1 Tax=Penaeus chinensis TaxID=139456 RepID=UPI001FB85AC4|nr:interleukin-1 receptor accessory protein-like 1 [Penaeus chinensis]
MATKGNWYISVMATLLLMSTWQLCESSGCPCSNRQVEFQEEHRNFKVDDVFAFMGSSLHCCTSALLGYEDRNATITWEFNGAPHPWPKTVSTFESQFCGPQTIETREVARTDAGNYTCTVTSSNGTVVKSTTRLNVFPITKFRDLPQPLVSPEDFYATAGMNANFSCKAYVGEFLIPPAGTFRKIHDNNTEIMATDMPNVTVTVTRPNRGVMKVEMVIHEVRQEHFGKYACDVSNVYGLLRKNVSLIDGMSEAERVMLIYKSTAIVISVVVVVSLLFSWLLWRLRIVIVVCWQRRTTAPLAQDKYNYDVFVIHGETASSWVWGVLVSMLETTYGYACFLPDRDLHGGEMVADTISAVMATCRRVLVVTTPCLPESRWGTWSLHSGIHSTLTSPTRILALKLQDMKFESTNAKDILRILKVVKTLTCTLGLWPARRPGNPPRCSRNQTAGLTIPEVRVEGDWSGSPKRQRLSNMILGSNNSSRENLDEEKGDKQVSNGGPVIYDQDDGLEDPGSPCSITPFILPSCNRQQTSKGCASLTWYMRVAFVKDSEEQFWLRLRYYLTPPSRPSHCTATYKA